MVITSTFVKFYCLHVYQNSDVLFFIVMWQQFLLLTNYRMWQTHYPPIPSSLFRSRWPVPHVRHSPVQCECLVVVSSKISVMGQVKVSHREAWRLRFMKQKVVQQISRTEKPRDSSRRERMKVVFSLNDNYKFTIYNPKFNVHEINSTSIKSNKSILDKDQPKI